MAVSSLVTIDNYEYEILTDYRDGFNEEALVARFSDVLSKYDYILGDWGYGQLRLKGFYDDRNSSQHMRRKSVHCRIIFMNTAILAVPTLSFGKLER